MPVTIKDVAALAGVSPSTVSRTCKNNPSISEETKEKVRKAMAQLNYEPNFQASNLAKQNSRTIGIILPVSAEEAYKNSFISKQSAASASSAIRDNISIQLLPEKMTMKSCRRSAR